MGDRTDDPAGEVLGVLVARLLLDRLVDLAQESYDDLPEDEREALRAACTAALRDSVPADRRQPPAVPRPRRPPSGGSLTPRELEVLGLVAEGRSNGEIGRQLFISSRTVSVHVSHLLAKLGAASRTEAVAIGRRHGLLVD